MLLNFVIFSYLIRRSVELYLCQTSYEKVFSQSSQNEENDAPEFYLPLHFVSST